MWYGDIAIKLKLSSVLPLFSFLKIDCYEKVSFDNNHV